MATIQRSSRLPSGVSQPTVSDFDTGINTSNAWTGVIDCDTTPTSSVSKARSKEYLSESNLVRSISDDGIDEDPEDVTVPARALYPFQGKAEFRELTVDAGDELDIIKEDVGEGWSLVKDSRGEVGLLPQTYYTLTFEFTSSPHLQLDFKERRTSESESSPTPRATIQSSSRSQLSLPSILPQHTGEWLSFPSFPQSLLGGKSLNRFSNFVTSGAEAFVLNGTTHEGLPTEPALHHSREDTTASRFESCDEIHSRVNLLRMGESDQHFIDSGPAGPIWRARTPAFSVLVHSPSKRTPSFSAPYTMYSITSTFMSPTPEATSDWVEVPDPGDCHSSSPTSSTGSNWVTVTKMTVQRRFSNFVVLHTVLSRRLPGIALPPLPEKQYAGRFSNDFIEARRGDLERYLRKIVCHPIVRYAEILTTFLSLENEDEWSRLSALHLTAPSAGPSFFGRIFHPVFNVDLNDAEDVATSFENYVNAVGKGLQGLRNIYGKVREARVEMSRAERLLSYSLLSLITSKPLSSTTKDGNQDEESPVGDKTVNKDGAWCWRESCTECLRLSKAVQKTCETLQTVANLYDGHARRTQLATHESLKLMAHPSSLYEGVLTTHKSTLSKCREAARDGNTEANEEMISRCETVLNVTMAEMNVYHASKVEDLKAIAVDHLDGEIAFYEQILSRLKAARGAYDGSQYEELGYSPRISSTYEKDISADFSKIPSLNPRPLPQPCPHVYDSAPMRPVSVAIQEGVGMFLGDGSGTSRMFSKFW